MNSARSRVRRALAPPEPDSAGRVAAQLPAAPPLTSLSAVPARPAVQRRCAACAGERDELPVQARLEVGAVDDRHEREADSIAAQLTGEVPPAAPVVRRSAEGGAGGETIAASHGELASGGAPLPEATRNFFEARLGRDLSGVRVHEGGSAQALNRSISARAFTYRNHVWLGAGESAAPSFTLAHELGHVMQQTAPGPAGGGSASAAPAAIQRQLRPPGNCNQGIHDGMQRQVKIWCDHPFGRTCVPGESCNRLRQKIHRNQMCARNRRAINVACYNGGDIGHRIAERDARRAQANCMAIYRAQCEERPPLPVPLPVPVEQPGRRPVPVPDGQQVPVPVPVPGVPVPVPGVPVPVPVAPRSTWDIVSEWARQVAASGEDATQAAERLLTQNPGIAGTIVGLGVVAILALLADDASGVGIADDVLIPIIAALQRVALRVLIFGAPAAAAVGAH
jgi:hypothetical protein